MIKKKSILFLTFFIFCHSVLISYALNINQKILKKNINLKISIGQDDLYSVIKIAPSDKNFFNNKVEFRVLYNPSRIRIDIPTTYTLNIDTEGENALQYIIVDKNKSYQSLIVTLEKNQFFIDKRLYFNGNVQLFTYFDSNIEHKYRDHIAGNNALSNLINDLEEKNIICQAINTFLKQKENQKFTGTVFSDDRYVLSNSKTKDLSNITIVIDAGHGGRDFGTTVGKKQIAEKTITLMYSNILADKLKKLGFNVILTRNSDYYVNLRERVKIARKSNATLLLSFHVNSEKSGKVNGTEIYTIANSKIKHDFFDLSYVKAYIPQKLTSYIRDNTTFNVLYDILKKTTKNKADFLRDSIVDALYKASLCKRCKVKEESFAILRGLDIPAICIEIGYLSNVNDELKMLSASYTRKFIDTVSDVIYTTYSRKN